MELNPSTRGLEKEYNSAHLTQNQLQEAFTGPSFIESNRIEGTHP
jgi:hypothetical protein